MRFAAVLNRDGGTLKTTDLDSYGEHLREAFSRHGHEMDVVAVPGNRLIANLREAFRDERFDAVIIGGGDGSVSAAASLAVEYDRMLGIIPAGTMNLYARSLKVPMEINEAAESLAAGRPGVSDMATANGEVFLHQFSVGLHPRVIRQRNRFSFASRMGKIGASMLAAIDAIRQPVSFPVRIEFEGRVLERVATSVAVSNNPYGEGHLPYADRVDQGRLGLYFVKGPLSSGNQARLLADLTLGTWRNNPDLQEFSCESVVLHFPKLRRDALAVMDGELLPLPRDVTLRIHPGALKVWLPGLVPTST
jgi:diacylglycerol kinase family enzyme